MKIQGTATLHADRERVFAALIDPEILARCIPGVESLDLTGDNSYKMTVSAGVGAIRGRYDGQVTLTELTRPDGYVMNARGAGGAGTVDATCRIELTENGAHTRLSYSADATVGGPVAGVGQRMIAGVAKRMAGQFFAAVDGELTGARAPLQPAGAESQQAQDAAGVAPPGRRLTCRLCGARTCFPPTRARCCLPAPVVQSSRWSVPRWAAGLPDAVVNSSAA